MDGGSYTFYPSFSEFVTLYRGVVRVWIGDGISTGTAGYLYAEYMDGLVQQIGFVSDYEEAKKYFSDLGIELTYPMWVDMLAKMPEHAKLSEAWALGTQSGVPVAQDDQTYHNNSRFYADQSKVWANGSNLNGESVQPENNSTFWANEAHGWANNKDGSVHGYSATNNAKYWTEQSKGYTNGNNLNGNPIQERATDNAEYFKNQSMLWATNGAGDTPGANNNSRYWAEQSKIFAKGTNLSDQSVQPVNNSEYFKNQAKLWANYGTDGDSPTASNNAKAYAENSEESNLEAESWAKGTRNGEADAVRQNASTDNASYYNTQSKLWATFGVGGDTPTSTNNAKSYSDQSNESRQLSEAWAVGTKDGVSDPSHATNNAKYYSDNADTQAQAAEESNLEAESWARGTKSGIADQERATDNALYYKNQAMLWANFGEDGATPTSSNNAKTYASQAGASATSAATSETNASDSATIATTKAGEASASASAAAASEANAATSETNAAQSESNAASSESNASSSEQNAATSAANAAQSESNSEAWAEGTRGGTPVSSSDPTYTHNAKYWADRAESAVGITPITNAEIDALFV